MVALRASPVLFPTEKSEAVYEAWRRRMLLEGTWRELLREHVQNQLGPLRARLVGEPDTSANLFSSVIDQTSTMFEQAPKQAHSDEGSLKVLRASLDGWWAMARQNQRYVRGLQWSAVYVKWDAGGKDGGHCSFEFATPDLVDVEWAPTNQGRAEVVWFARRRPVPGKALEEAWFWDRWALRNERGEPEPSLTIWTNDRKREITASFIDPAEWRGARYPWRDEDGQPLLPFVFYWAIAPGVCGPHHKSEVVFGTLQVGLLWTAAVHGMLRASWDQRVLLNGRVKGGTVEQPSQAGGASIRTLTPDPTGITQVDGENASIDAWGASIDIDKAERFCRLYEARLAVHFGLSPADLVIESLNPASGASITVSQAGKRRLAERDAVNFQRSDLELAELVAAMSRAKGKACTAKGLRLRYHGVKLTIDERVKVMQYVEKELELGLLDLPGAYQELHPGTSRDDAIADLDEFAKHKRSAERREAVLVELAKPSIEEAAPAAGAPPAGEQPLAATALNGAQVTSALDIVKSVARRELPRDTGVAMLVEFFQLSLQGAEKVMGKVGESFFIVAPAPEPAPAKAPPPPGAEDEDATEAA